MWEGQLQNGDIPRDLKETETQLRNLNEHITHIQTSTYEVIQRGKELLQVTLRSPFYKNTIVFLLMTHTMINLHSILFIWERK